MAFAGVGITLLWPSKRWIGKLCLAFAGALVAYWGYIEFWARFWVWVYGTHGPTLYMFIGGITCLLLLIIISTLSVVVRRYRARSKPAKGFLDYKNDAEVSMSALPSLTAKLTDIMSDVGAAFDKHTMTMSHSGGSTSNQLRVMKRVASQLDNYSARTAAIGITFVKTGCLLSEGLIGWSGWLKEAHPNKAALGAGFPETLRSFTGSLDTSNGQLRDYITTVRNVKGAASIMDAALDRHIHSWQAILETNIKLHNACLQTLHIIDELT